MSSPPRRSIQHSSNRWSAISKSWESSRSWPVSAQCAGKGDTSKDHNGCAGDHIDSAHPLCIQFSPRMSEAIEANKIHQPIDPAKTPSDQQSVPIRIEPEKTEP